MAEDLRRLRPETELARVQDLLARADRIAGSTVLLTERLPRRRQKKLRTYKRRSNGSLGIDIEALAAEFAGRHVVFQIREEGQVSGTASWRVPEAPPRGTEPPGLVQRTLDGTVYDEAEAAKLDLAKAIAEIGTFAEVRAESRLLAEEVRSLRTTVERLQHRVARAEAERKEAVRARKRAEAELTALRADNEEQARFIWVMRERMGLEDFQEVAEMVRGGA
jgi:hypothetical protein